MNTPTLGRVGVYCRCSTREQDTAMQKHAITEYLQARGYSSVEIYEDYLSGTSAKRPGLIQLLKDARARRLDTIVVYKLDRWFRSLRETVNTLEELRELGVTFISLKDQLDFSTSAGRLMFHMIGAFAEFERAIITERIHSGLAAARARGRRLGRPKTRNDEPILALRKKGYSMRRIARELGLSKGSVQRAIAGGPNTPSLVGAKSGG